MVMREEAAHQRWEQICLRLAGRILPGCLSRRQWRRPSTPRSPVEKREIHEEKDVKLSVVGDLHTNRATGGPIRSTAAQMQLGYDWWRPRLQREDEGFRCTVPHHIPPVSSVHAVHDTIALCGGTSPGRRGNKLAPSRPQPVVRFSAFAATSADLPACSTH